MSKSDDGGIVGGFNGRGRLNIRQNYSNPPLHAARLVEKILNSPALFEEWTKEVRMVAQRVIDMRLALRNELVAIGTPGTWDHITSQIGMFSFTGISKKQCQVLTEKHHIYLTLNGRISMAGINSKNVKYVAAAFKDVVENVRD